MLDQAVQVLKQGGVILCPTETLPGFSCLPDKSGAIERILSIKQRSSSKGLILIAANLHQLDPWIEPLNDNHKNQIAAANESPTTWLVQARTHVNHLLRGHHDSLAIRISSHPVVCHLCSELNSALVSTSANISGQQAALTIDAIPESVIKQVDLTLNGQPGTGKASHILHIRDSGVVR